jgi:hypothetical protein
MGWVADSQPQVVRKIAQAGHQIGCHSYAHRLVYSLTPAQFREDTVRAVEALENACGVTPRLYRAPLLHYASVSLGPEILVECGFQCDSSIVPINHDRYGIPGLNATARFCKRLPTDHRNPGGNRPRTERTIVPVGGGAYLRLPYRYGCRTVGGSTNKSVSRHASFFIHGNSTRNSRGWQRVWCRRCEHTWGSAVWRGNWTG